MPKPATLGSEELLGYGLRPVHPLKTALAVSTASRSELWLSKEWLLSQSTRDIVRTAPGADGEPVVVQ